MVRTIAMLLVAVVIAVSGVKLARYADADDSPGGMVVGAVMVMGAMALALAAFLPRKRKL